MTDAVKIRLKDSEGKVENFTILPGDKAKTVTYEVKLSLNGTVSIRHLQGLPCTMTLDYPLRVKPK